MKRLVYVAAALFMAAVIFVACGGDPEPTATPEPTDVPSIPPTTQSSAPTAEATPPPPTDQPTTPPTSVPTSTPYPTASPSPDVDTSGYLSAQCVPDGTLDSAAVVTSCGILAAQDIESVSFVAEVDLLSLFPVDGSGGSDFSMTLNGIMVQAGRLQFDMVLNIAGATSTLGGVYIGNDTYFKNPDSGQWYEGDPPDTEFLTALQMVGFLISPNDPTATFDDIVDLEDGSRGYVLISEFAGQGGGTGLAPGSAGSVTRTVDATDFLTRKVVVAEQGSDGETRDFITITYSGYNEPYELEPPDELLSLSN